MDSIEMGDIGLPDIQRPFVWKNAKVRDLFDSMYRGYPVGYLLLWRINWKQVLNKLELTSIKKCPTCSLSMVQQCLTSLYAVLKGIPVVRRIMK